MGDILKIRTYAAKKLISMALSKILSKKMGCDVKIWLETFEITNADGENAHITFGGKATLPIDKISIF